MPRTEDAAEDSVDVDLLARIAITPTADALLVTLPAGPLPSRIHLETASGERATRHLLANSARECITIEERRRQRLIQLLM